jgi:hypothetical protein
MSKYPALIKCQISDNAVEFTQPVTLKMRIMTPGVAVATSTAT